MSRRPRVDVRGWWQHIMNRGIGKRVIFEIGKDVQVFLALLASMVRAGRIELHAYTVLPNHFHLLVRSLKGELSQAMHWIQNQYSKYFNRSRGRVGPLYNSRYKSCHVDSASYWVTVVRYIHQNPVKAGLCRSPLEYPYGSAIHLARDSRPVWLESRLVEEVFTEFAGQTSGGMLRAELERPLPQRLGELVERRLASSRRAPDYLDELLRSAPEQIRQKLRKRARHADGFPASTILVHPDTVVELVRPCAQDHPDWLSDGRKRKTNVWSSLEVGLLREACGSSQTEIAQRSGLAPSTIARLANRHRRLLADDERYVEWASKILHEALQRDFPGPLAPADLLERWPKVAGGGA